MNSKVKVGGVMALSIAFLAIGGLLSLQMGSVYAATPVNTFYEKVLQKLGITNVTADQLKTAVIDSREEVRKTDMEAKLTEALKANKLTQAQVDLAKKVFVVRETLREENRAKFEALSETEREALRGTRPNQVDKDKLAKAVGISTTDLEKLETALFEAGIGPMKEMGRRGGHMRGMGMMN